MPEISLDFQPRRPSRLAVVALIVSLLLAADAWREDSALRAAQDDAQLRLDQALQRAARADAGRRDSRPESVFSAPETKALRQAIDAIRVDWEALYRDIDRAVSEDVALLAIRPSVTGRSVQISGEARDLAAALAFVDALHGRTLTNVALISHQLKQSDPQLPIVFEIVATWLSAS